MGRVETEFKRFENDNGRHLCICRDCAKETYHYIIFKYDENSFQSYGRGSGVSWKNSNQIIQCLGCETVSFRTVYTDSESYEEYYDDEGNSCSYAVETIKYYPGLVEGLGSIDTSMLPAKISGIYRETLHSIENEQYILAGIGLRAIIETVCKDLDASGKNLHAKINSLKEMSIVTAEGVETLHRLRVLGNDAAHEVKAHNSQQLQLAIKIIEHILDGTYLIPQKVKAVFK